MAKFTDAKGRMWPLTINVGLLGRLRRDAGFDLSKIGEGMAETMTTDPGTLVKVLWVLLLIYRLMNTFRFKGNFPIRNMVGGLLCHKGPFLMMLLGFTKALMIRSKVSFWENTLSVMGHKSHF